MARWQRHILHIRHVPRRDNHTTRVGVILDCVNHLLHLVNSRTVGLAPTAPLIAIDVVEVAICITLNRRRCLLLRRNQKFLHRDWLHALLCTQLLIEAVGIVIPDVYTVIHQILNIGISRQEPQQLVNYTLQKYTFCGEQRETLAQIKAHLIAEDASCACACAVTLHDTILLDLLQ